MDKPQPDIAPFGIIKKRSEKCAAELKDAQTFNAVSAAVTSETPADPQSWITIR